MVHTSIKMETPIEFINIVKISPLISKCQIKVCYVGEEPNRNKSIITKEVAREMAQSLPGSPIVGYYKAEDGDFEEHNKLIDVSNGRFDVIDMTKPYGFVDLNAKVWFQKFLDDGVYEHEYLMTEGYLWTTQYPECQRVIDQGNNQSMELDEKSLDAKWTKDKKGFPQFFIINEAIISKLCILGEECEPCFEGSTITAPTIEFSLSDSFKQQLFSMREELKELYNEGGTKVPDTTITNQQIEEPIDFNKKKEDEELCPDCGKPMTECACGGNKKKKKYNLEEVSEYIELEAKYNELTAQYNELNTKYNALVEEQQNWETTKTDLNNQIDELKNFKLATEKKEKEQMIASFYMLSDEDKKEVSDNIDSYSLDDIEAKLSILCVRNKVSFSLDDDKGQKEQTTFNLNSTDDDDDDEVPAWIKAVQATADAMD